MKNTKGIPPTSCKVLVVEDEGLIALDISNRLEAMGHEVVATVGTSEEALEEAGKADIVLMDIRIDGPVDGIETAARIREKHHLPVIFLSAFSDRTTLDRAKLTCPFGYIVKPVSPASLHSSIEMALYKHNLERRTEENEALLRTTLGSVPDALVITDHMSRVLMLNSAAEQLTGWTHAEAEGQSVMKVLRLVDAAGEPLEDQVPLAILKDAPVSIERSVQMVSRAGQQLMIEGSAAPVKMPGIPLGVVIAFRDVSARLWEEKQIRQAQQVDAAGRLAAHVSDEYTGLLAVVRNQSENLLRQFGEYSPARQAIEEIQQSAASAEAITRRLATLGTRQAARQSELLSINGILRRMAKVIESVAGSRVELAIRPSPVAGKVKGDSGQLEEAMMNLILHACARMPNGGQLLIETGNTDLPQAAVVTSYVALNIAYSAQEPDLEKLFEPTSLSEDGLALAMVHGIVTEHGGYISAQLTARGCRFEILLPRAADLLLLETPAEPSHTSTVLLVDYREQVRAQLHNFFEAQGYNLLEAVDDQEALALGEMHEGSLDLIVAEAGDADRVGVGLRERHPEVQVLRIVDHPELSENEIARPFTQSALLEKAAHLLQARAATSSSAV